MATFLFLVTSLLLAAGPARALPETVLDSIVAVVPDLPIRQRLSEPEGSGVVLYAGGYVATAAHVMGTATTARLRLQDGRQITARLIGSDITTDLALLLADRDLPVIDRGPAPGLADPVCAIGNPFGLGNSVSCGVVSALRRTGTGFNPVEDFIQTDATVNPGMSGGALVTPDGRLVGIVTAIFTKDSDANIGVNFASSLDLLLRVASDLRDHGRFQPAVFPLRTRPLTPGQDRAPVGVLISGPLPEDSAFQPGDAIIEIDRRPIRKPADIASAIGLRRPGDRVEVVADRAGQTITGIILLPE
ncbi:MAG: trypsin-like peptidase domain-containing protein [Rhodospirillales bacterium]